MIELRHNETARVGKQRLLAMYENVEDYRNHLNDVAGWGGYNELEGTINLPFDDVLARTAYDVADAMRNPNLQYVFVVGIGGSYLGTKAVYDALGGYYDAFRKATPKLIFIETVNGVKAEYIQTLIEEEIESAEQFVVSVNTKSGTTPETIFNAEMLIRMLQAKVGDSVHSRIVVTTQKSSPLWPLAEEKGYPVLENSENVGGRYSVLCPIGVFPLALANIDVEALREGARNARDRCLRDNDDNIARASAAALYTAFMEGKSIHDTFFFVQHLEGLGGWYRQLMAESIGKEKNLEGETVHTGMTPTVSVGSNDLHATVQNVWGGPRDKVTSFVWTKSYIGTEVPMCRAFPGINTMLDGRSGVELMAAILEGTKETYRKLKLPFMEIVFDDVNAYSVGEFLQFKMMEIMYLGHMMYINTFDQPNVELYKIETKRILEENG